jgi:hypothetical protein
MRQSGGGTPPESHSCLAGWELVAKGAPCNGGRKLPVELQKNAQRQVSDGGNAVIVVKDHHPELAKQTPLRQYLCGPSVVASGATALSK